MVSKRPFKITTQEIATLFWCVGLFIIIITLYMTYGMIYTQTSAYTGFIIPFDMILFLGMGVFFMFLGYAFPCYQISKWDCNPFMDKLEPGWDVWLRCAKNRRFAPQCVKTGPLGQEKGLVSGYKADIINRGDFSITLRNGNHAVLKYDLMSHNISLNEAVGWQLTTRKYGLLGTNAYKKCLSDEKTVKKPKKQKEERK